MRLDVFLTDSGITKSRSQAVESIKLGLVSVNGNTSVKPSLSVTGSENIILLGDEFYEDLRYAYPCRRRRC